MDLKQLKNGYMTLLEFNEKYNEYIDEGFDGLEFDIPEVTDMLDRVFEDLIKIPGFSFAQIKIKYGQARFYSSLNHTLSRLIESEINYLLKQHDEELEQKDKKCN
jgi:hypothetical protein